MPASAELEAPPTGAMVPAPFVVRRRRRETSDTWTLTLEPLQGEGISPAPGQFTMLYVFGVGEVPISVSGTDGGMLVHTVRAVGAVSAAICAAKPGAVLGVRGPFGTVWPLREAVGRDVVVVAGGVGLAPLRTAVQTSSASATPMARSRCSTAGARPATCCSAASSSSGAAAAGWPWT